MVIGITMIKILPDHEKAGYDALREIEGVKEIYHLFEALDRARLSQLLEEIRLQRYVHDTWSLLVSEESSHAIHPDIGMAFSQVGELAVS
jgi:hypothetical protein